MSGWKIAAIVLAILAVWGPIAYYLFVSKEPLPDPDEDDPFDQHTGI